MARLEEIKIKIGEIDEYIRRRIRGYEAEIVNLVDSKMNLEYDIDGCKKTVENLTHEIEAQEVALHEAIKGKVYREEILMSSFPDTYQAVVWFRENKQLFSGKVFEPMTLEINVPQEEYAKCVECIIPKGDLLAFTCEDINDMDLLISKLRLEQNLMINIIHSGQEHAPSHAFQPDIPIEDLRQFGFVAYMKDLISAPEIIMKYLCRMLHIHNIPIGSEETNAMYENVPSIISMFCSHDTKYVIEQSNYSGLPAITTNTIDEAEMLSSNIDYKCIEEKLEYLQREREGLLKLLSNMEVIKKITERELDANEKSMKELIQQVITNEEAAD